MLDHHIQRTIVYRLAFNPSLRFSELKPDNIDNKLFTYHLKKVLSTGLVTKSDTGVYTLTPEGRRISTGAFEKEQALIVERPLSVLFLVIRRKHDGAWLFYRRNTHPMLGFSGFMHCTPTLLGNSDEAARKQCAAKSGLDGHFMTLGGGYFRIYQDDTLESFTHFTLLYCEDMEDTLTPNDSKADYFWVDTPDFSDPTLFPGTQLLSTLYEAKKPFFIEKTFSIEASHA